jgi:hypothetical protein
LLGSDIWSPATKPSSNRDEAVVEPATKPSSNRRRSRRRTGDEAVVEYDEDSLPN